MSLKNLTVKQAELEEKAIEQIVAPYMKYAEDTGKILINADLRKLGYEEQIGHYLIAKLGWKYLGNTELAKGAGNEEIEKVLGINGNTVRVNIKKLRDGGYLTTGTDKLHSPTIQLAYKFLES